MSDFRNFRTFHTKEFVDAAAKTTCPKCLTQPIEIGSDPYKMCKCRSLYVAYTNAHDVTSIIVENYNIFIIEHINGHSSFSITNLNSSEKIYESKHIPPIDFLDIGNLEFNIETFLLFQ